VSSMAHRLKFGSPSPLAEHAIGRYP
jgi:hypothetical protein